MNNQFDELTKSLAQSVSRRAALKQFGLGLAGMALACFGLVNRVHATQGNGQRCGDGYPPCPKNHICLNGHCAKYRPFP